MTREGRPSTLWRGTGSCLNRGLADATKGRWTEENEGEEKGIDGGSFKSLDGEASEPLCCIAQGPWSVRAVLDSVGRHDSFNRLRRDVHKHASAFNWTKSYQIESETLSLGSLLPDEIKVDPSKQILAVLQTQCSDASRYTVDLRCSSR